ncbi:MAG: lipocalin family protein [Syntrophotaleaceae bacterium]
MKRFPLMTPLWAFCLLLLPGCGGIPEGITPITNFELHRYLGQWYEVARLDHSFERGLSNVTASYNLRTDGGVEVINRGYNLEKQSWREARGKAYFVREPTVGQLKVSFFGPFYGGYNIIALDQRDYSYALVCGPNLRYLWILARTPRLSPAALQMLLAKARQLGFATDELIYPKHDRIPPNPNQTGPR